MARDRALPECTSAPNPDSVDPVRFPPPDIGDTHGIRRPVSPRRRPSRGASASFRLVAGPAAHTAGVDSERAQLSSASTTLEDLVARVTAAGERLHAAGEESLAHELFEVERALRGADRRLRAVTSRMRS